MPGKSLPYQMCSFSLVKVGYMTMYPTLMHSRSSKWPFIDTNATVFLFFIQNAMTKFKDFVSNTFLHEILSTFGNALIWGIPTMVWWCLVSRNSSTVARLEPSSVHINPNDTVDRHIPSWMLSITLSSLKPLAKTTWKTIVFSVTMMRRWRYEPYKRSSTDVWCIINMLSFDFLSFNFVITTKTSYTRKFVYFSLLPISTLIGLPVDDGAKS